ncbi:MAG: NAD(P)/FAD-dependent oxidoreductase [Patescibacteria group bacterium]
MDRYDVIVIGAGVAGLAAAQELTKAGESVVVLEAQDYIGGRIKTLRERGVVEAGAEFVHGEYARTWETIRDAGITTSEWKVSDASIPHRSYGDEGSLRPIPPALVKEADALRACVYAYEGPEISLADYLLTQTVSEEARVMVDDALSRLEATDADKLSVLGMARASKQASNGHQNFFLPDGYDRIPEKLAEGLDIRLAHAVSGIVWKKGDVHITCSNSSTFSASSIIITVPLGVLQQARISFSPELPVSFTEALGKIGFGQTTKSTFWIRGWVPSFRMLLTRYSLSFWQRTFGEETVVVGYCGGSLAERLAVLSEKEALEYSLSALADALGPDIREQVVHARHFTWSDNPYIQGAYSYPKLHMGNAREIIRTPIEHTIFYAGEATHTSGHAATVHGAIEEGIDAARRLLG